MNTKEISRLHDRSWLTATFSIVRLWWVAIGPIVLARLRKWNLVTTFDILNKTVKLSIGETVELEVYHKDDENREHGFTLKIWRTRFFVRCAPK